MSTNRQTFSIRLTTDEKATVTARAESYGMSVSEYSRYCLLNATPPQVTVQTVQNLPTYEALAAHVHRLDETTSMLTSALTNVASSDSVVATALEQARAALGPREE